MKTITRSDPSVTRPHVLRRVAAEFVGTGLLVTVVVGSGIAAQRLSPGDVGLQLLENSVATALGLTVLILMLGPVSGAHFNPVVSLADWLAGVMFDTAPALSGHNRATGGHLVGELVATAGLVLLVFALARAGNGSVTAAAVGAYIGAAYWFTSSTSFANPAVTIARMFTDTFAGIAPASVAPFILAQLVGGALGLAMLLVFYPTAARTAGDVVVPTQPETTS